MTTSTLQFDGSGNDHWGIRVFACVLHFGVDFKSAHELLSDHQDIRDVISEVLKEKRR